MRLQQASACIPLTVKFTEFSAAFDEQAGGARMRPWHTARPNTARPSVLGGIAMAINYTVGDNWGSGFTGSMTVPGGSQGLQGWTLEFDATFNITNVPVVLNQTGNGEYYADGRSSIHVGRRRCKHHC